MDFDIDRRELLKATGTGIATVTVATGTAGAQTPTPIDQLPGDGSEGSPYELGSFEDLLAIDQELDANYVLTDNIEFGSETRIDPLALDQYTGNDFTGVLDGQGFEIRDFEIAGDYSGSGLFAFIGTGGVVKNLDIVNIDVMGDGVAGGLAGVFDGGTDGKISNVSVTGKVQGGISTGGLVGRITSGTIGDSFSSATVESSYGVGGAVGRMTGGGIKQTYAEGDVKSDAGEFTSSAEAGGFVGSMNGGKINMSFAIGDVQGSSAVGGFVGQLTNNGEIMQAYARGDVLGIPGVESPPERLGGFAGSVGTDFRSPGTIEEVYSTGAILVDGGGSNLGGLVGRVDETQAFGAEQDSVGAFSSHVTNGYWDVPASGIDSSDGGTGLGNLNDPAPADEMTGNDAPNNMDGFDFDNTWVTVTGDENAIIGFSPTVSPAETGIQIQATQPTGPGYPVFGWQIEEDEKTCIDRRNLGRGQEDDECPFDRDIERGGSRRELDRNTGRGGDGEHTDSETSRRDRGRGSRRGR